MGLITFKHKGSFSNIEAFFNRVLSKSYRNILAKYGELGVEILKDATPVQSGATRDAWDFEIEDHDGMVTLAWTNSNENEGLNVALLIIYGHGLENGAYVEGVDFVNPVIRPLMQDLANKAWREVTK